MVKVGRAINGISINGLEYLLCDFCGEVMTFTNEEKAKEFLRVNGISEDVFEQYIYEEV
jgi:hypothetical protein